MRERMLTAHGETRSVAEWARLKGLTKTILIMRLDRGWSPERAVDTPRHTRKAHPRRTYACPDGVERTVREMADMASVSEDAMRMRLKNGWSVERALTEPPVTRGLLDIDGESLTLEAWTRRSGVPRSVITSRLRQGWNARDAVFTPTVRQRKRTPLTAHGETHSVAEWARLKGLTYEALTGRLDRGWSAERAVDTPVHRKTRSGRRIKVGGDALTVTEWSERNGISRRTIVNRLAAGWDPVRAVTEPAGRRKPRHRDKTCPAL